MVSNLKPCTYRPNLPVMAYLFVFSSKVRASTSWVESSSWVTVTGTLDSGGIALLPGNGLLKQGRVSMFSLCLYSWVRCGWMSNSFHSSPYTVAFWSSFI